MLAPAIVSGNTAVLVASERYPLLAVAFAEAASAAGLPAGVVNVLTGDVAEISPWLAAHQDVNAIDLTGAPGPLADDLAVAAAGNLKRVVRLPVSDWGAEPGPRADVRHAGDQDDLAPAGAVSAPAAATAVVCRPPAVRRQPWRES